MSDRNDPVTIPRCPSCDGPMVLRTNRRQGNSFWGCQKYPARRGTRDISSNSQEAQIEDAAQTPAQVRVLWNDATLERRGWQCRYTTAGGRLRSSPALALISNEFRQCWIARTEARFSATDDVRRVTGAIRKLIQRESNPPIHPNAEMELLNYLGLQEYICPSALPGDLGLQLEPDVFQDLSNQMLNLPDPGFDLDEEVRLESGPNSSFSVIGHWRTLVMVRRDGSYPRLPLMPLLLLSKTLARRDRGSTFYGLPLCNSIRCGN